MLAIDAFRGGLVHGGKFIRPVRQAETRANPDTYKRQPPGRDVFADRTEINCDSDAVARTFSKGRRR